VSKYTLIAVLLTNYLEILGIFLTNNLMGPPTPRPSLWPCMLLVLLYTSYLV
jgi:hypothetical protein